ncbi:MULTISPECIES: peptidoglycan bridge formation glycyltransferase FemA/FemB family protein [unclassified Enterococcus]|uniref:peptidoglycan bridge formation glycyltransferase FemA/FemB family protein n=1 Tax=unclassified Enterococcus TaxID=2608891 RepID=UPI00155727B9|nr:MULTISPECIES: peptidoglycan bridge formation glycyltransferase FemA/FemB family protein [unclassified Enterococcus]MBS7576869.1 peptidoglycan bridge formation glycyltransferase FemA/FemB family protein [Enterococcus sp. MMGLQ5-2]MBS7584276.1 peptidoglycan bridge formation glycyltransferase FemA/FemB family protein [Enterococcus sp. MMGLQ5-1]NPD12132.1 peptidoglycan bridge formation glycyltransferase FemA/FemB family protein [Enterococcus sp. MMGLQ5-1]NPD36704.1 peptidoglycan bridge formation
MEFIEVSEQAFAEFTAKQTQVHFQQTVEMGKLQQALGHQIGYYGVLANGELQTALLVILSKIKFGYLAEAHGNPYFSEDLKVNQFLIEQLKNKLKGLGIIKLVIHSNQMIAEYNDKWEEVATFQPKLNDFYQSLGLKVAVLNDFELGFQYNYEKNLSNFSDYASAVKSFKKQARQSINRAKGFGIKIVELPYERLADFKAVVDEAGDRRHFSTRSLRYYQSAFQAYGERTKFLAAEINFQSYLSQTEADLKSIQSEINKLAAEIQKQPTEKKQNKLNDIKTFQLKSAEKRQAEAKALVKQYGCEDVVLAVAQFYIMPNEIIYMFSGMYDHFREFSAPFLIQDYMLNYAVNHQIERYNFMGVNSPKDEDQGVLRFKQNFKGFIWRSSGNFEMIVRPNVYRLTQLLKKIIGH